ncbi:hypothetical protein FBU30_000739 [Linnemannia zychae]|nr:hypothetical protein FBU30_000739 [Linnemannia zychae]
MLHNAVTDNQWTLTCLVDGDKVSFEIDIDPNKTVTRLKDLIKDKIPDTFNGLDAKDLTLWKVSIPVAPKNERKEISLADVPQKDELDETDDIVDITEPPSKKTIHIIVRRPSPQVLSRSLSPLPGTHSDGSRPNSPLSGDLHADIKKITDKFFAPGPIVDFLDAFVKGEG